MSGEAGTHPVGACVGAALGDATTATFDEREPIARAQWEQQEDAILTWDDARPAAEDAYKRLAKRRAK